MLESQNISKGMELQINGNSGKGKKMEIDMMVLFCFYRYIFFQVNLIYKERFVFLGKKKKE